MSYSTTFVTSLGSCIWTILEDVSNLVAVVADWLVSILSTVPAMIEVRRQSLKNRSEVTWQYVLIQNIDNISPFHLLLLDNSWQNDHICHTCSILDRLQTHTLCLEGPCRCPWSSCCPRPWRPPGPAPDSPWRSVLTCHTDNTLHWSSDPPDTLGRNVLSSHNDNKLNLTYLSLSVLCSVYF